MTADAMGPVTDWSLLEQAVEGGEAGRVAFAKVYGLYWPGTYEYARRRGVEAEDAEDVVQDLWVGILTRDTLASMRRDKGRFRGYLAKAVRSGIAEWRRNARAKRRGGDRVLTMDPAELRVVERDLLSEPELDPETALARRNARRVLAEARNLLEQAWSGEKAKRFRLLSPYLEHDAEAGEYQVIAKELETTLETVRQLVSRLRKRHAKIVSHLTDAPDGREEVKLLRDEAR